MTAALAIGLVGAAATTSAQPLVAAAATVEVGGVYVANNFPLAVTQYPLRAQGDVAPVGQHGQRSGFLTGVAVDSAGTVYVANFPDATVKEYPAGANDDTDPARQLGPGNGIYGPTFLTIDGADNLYVSNGGNNSIAVFSYGARTIGGASDGDLPVRTISGPSTNLNSPQGIALGPDGTLYVANQGGNGTAGGNGNSITVYAPGANGDAAPIRTIRGTATKLHAPMGIALDPNGRLYVANNGSNTVTVYAPGASGKVTPVRTIGGGSTLLQGPYGVALNPVGTIYVTNNKTAYPNGRVTEYRPSANGNTPPVGIIGGPNTRLGHPTGIFIAARASVTTTETTLTPSSSPATVGQPVTLTATVSPVPDGSTVSFQTGVEGGNCALVPLVGGTASCTVTYPSAKFICPSATYNGDANFAASTKFACFNVNDPPAKIS